MPNNGASRKATASGANDHDHERPKPSTNHTPPGRIQFHYQRTLDEEEQERNAVHADIVASIQKAAGYDTGSTSTSAAGKKKKTEEKEKDAKRSKRSSVASTLSATRKRDEVFHQYTPTSSEDHSPPRPTAKATDKATEEEEPLFQELSFPVGRLSSLRSEGDSFTGTTKSWRVLDLTPPEKFPEFRSGEGNSFINSLHAASAFLDKTETEIKRRNSAVMESNEAFLRYHEEANADVKKTVSGRTFDSMYDATPLARSRHTSHASVGPTTSTRRRRGSGPPPPPSDDGGNEHSDGSDSDSDGLAPAQAPYIPGEVPLPLPPSLKEKARKKTKAWLLGEDTKRAKEYEQLKEKITSIVKKVLDHANHAGLMVITLNTQAMRALPSPYSTYASVVSNTLQIFWERFVTMPVDHKKSLFNWIKRCASQVEIVVDALELATDNVELVESALRRPLLRVIVSCQQAAVGLQELAELPHFIKIFTRDDVRERVTELGLATNHAISGFVAAVFLASTSALDKLAKQQAGNMMLSEMLLEKQKDMIKLIKSKNRLFAQEEYDELRTQIANGMIADFEAKRSRQLLESQFERTYKWFQTADVPAEARSAAQKLHKRFGALAMIPEEDESKAPDLEDLKAATLDVDQLHEHIQKAKEQLISGMDDSEALEAKQVIEDVIRLRKDLHKALENTPTNTPAPSRHGSIVFGNVSRNPSKKNRVSVSLQSSLGLKETTTDTEELGAKLREQVNEKKQELLRLLTVIDQLEKQRKIMAKDESIKRFHDQQELVLRKKTAMEILQGFKFDRSWPSQTTRDLHCALWKPADVNVGDIGYVHDAGHFVSCCNIWDATFHWDKFDASKFPGVSQKRYSEMIEERLNRVSGVTNHKKYEGDLWNRRKSVALSTSVTKMRQKYNQWSPDVYVQAGKPCADIRVKSPRRKAVEGSDLNKLVSWWQKYHDVFEDMLLEELNMKGYSVKELVLVCATLETHKYALMVSDIEEGKEDKRFKFIEQHDDADDWCKLVKHGSEQVYNTKSDPHFQVKFSKRQVKSRNKKNDNHTVFVGLIRMVYLPVAGKWMATYQP